MGMAIAKLFQCMRCTCVHMSCVVVPVPVPAVPVPVRGRFSFCILCNYVNIEREVISLWARRLHTGV